MDLFGRKRKKRNEEIRQKEELERLEKEEEFLKLEPIDVIKKLIGVVTGGGYNVREGPGGFVIDDDIPSPGQMNPLQKDSTWHMYRHYALEFKERDRNNQALACIYNAIKVRNESPKDILTSGPENWELWHTAGLIANSMADSHLVGTRLFDKAIELQKRDNGLENWESWFEKGKLLYFDDPEESIACFDRAIDLDHERFVVWREKCGVLMCCYRYEEVIACCDEVIEIISKRATAFEEQGSKISYANGSNWAEESMVYFGKADKLYSEKRVFLELKSDASES